MSGKFDLLFRVRVSAGRAIFFSPPSPLWFGFVRFHLPVLVSNGNSSFFSSIFLSFSSTHQGFFNITELKSLFSPIWRAILVARGEKFRIVGQYYTWHRDWMETGTIDENRIFIVTKSFRLVIFSRAFFLFHLFVPSECIPSSFHSLATNLSEIEIVVQLKKKKRKIDSHHQIYSISIYTCIDLDSRWQRVSY